MMTASSTELLRTLLNRIYLSGNGTRRPWKDQMSDWLLDRYADQGAVEARDVLHGLCLYRPQLLEDLLKRPDLQDDLTPLLDPSWRAPHARSSPDSTRSMA